MSRSPSAPPMPLAWGGSGPAHSGWSVGKTMLEWSGDPCTRQPSASATAVRAGTPPDAATSSPATTTSRSGLVAARRRASSSRSSGTDRRSIMEGAGTGASPCSSSRSMGIDTNTGPAGAVVASWNARRMIVPSSSSVATSWVHFETDAARPVRSPARRGSWWRWRRSCCPAVTTSGVPFACAFVRFPMALPSPAEVWRFSTAGRPVTWA